MTSNQQAPVPTLATDLTPPDLTPTAAGPADAAPAGPIPTVPRRTVVVAAALGAAATATATTAATVGRAAAARAPERATPAGGRLFAHGVASGDPRPRSVVLWTRVTPTPASVPGSGKGPRVRVRWEVAADRDFRRIVRNGHLVTSASRDHTVKVDAQGLEPATAYWYRFVLDGVASPLGRTRTAPAEAADPAGLVFGVVSCSNYPAGFFGAYRHLAGRDDLDAVLHLGDYIYEYGNGEYGAARDVQPAHETVSLSDYRQRHATYKQDPDLMLLHARHPFITIWDDHEIADNSWSDGAKNHDAGEGDFGRRKARAHRAYDEWMPIRLDGTAALQDGTRLYRSLSYGTLADLTMLDLRSYRDEQVATPVVDPEVADPDRTITGVEQLAWLKHQLSASQATWKLVGTSVMIAPLGAAALPVGVAEALAQLTGPIPSDLTINTDQWDGYTADRRELFDHIAANDISGVVCLTGDIHSAWASELPLDTATYPVSGTAGVEFVVTSVTSDNIDEITGAPPHTVSDVAGAALMAANRHIKFVNLDDHGYGVLTLTPEEAQMDYYVLDDKMDKDTGVRWDTGYLTAKGSGTLTAASRPRRGASRER